MVDQGVVEIISNLADSYQEVSSLSFIYNRFAITMHIYIFT